MRKIKVEWCENFIKARFTKHHPFQDRTLVSRSTGFGRWLRNLVFGNAAPMKSKMDECISICVNLMDKEKYRSIFFADSY